MSDWPEALPGETPLQYRQRLSKGQRAAVLRAAAPAGPIMRQSEDDLQAAIIEALAYGVIVIAPPCPVPGCGGCLPGKAWRWVYCHRCRPPGYYPYINRSGRLVRRPQKQRRRVMAQYEVRSGEWDPRRDESPRARTFSVGIGKAGTRQAAIYRVSGSTGSPEEVDRLAARLAAWLNNPERIDRSPYDVPYSNDGHARIVLTAAGKAAGWLRP